MMETRKHVSTEHHPFAPPPEDKFVVVKVTESEMGPNSNPDAKYIRQVSINTKTHILGRCLRCDHKLVSEKVNYFLKSHPGQLTDESLAELKAIVSNTRSTLFDVDESTVAVVSPRGKPKPNRGKNPKSQAVELTLPLEHTTRRPPDKEEFASENQAYWSAPIEELRATAFGVPDESPSMASDRTRYLRSVAVRVYVQLRAKGHCECCGQPAPFITTNGQPYLESHHTIPVSVGGPDHPHWVIALCPACHRHAHYASDAEDFNAELIRIVNAIEPLQSNA